MKKEYHFTISRTDRFYLVGLIGLLLGWEMIKLVIPVSRFHHANTMETPNHESTGTLSLPDADTLMSDGIPPFTKNERISDSSRIKMEDTTSALHPVNIMEASVEEMLRIGFQKKVAYSIEKYRTAGGQIQNQEKLMKIYGMDSAQLHKVMPNILFPKPSESKKYPFEGKSGIITQVDLNTADSAMLEALPGIGAVLSSRIVKYRDRLGGFFSLEQLKECYGVKEETFDLIRPYLMLTTPPHRFNLNEENLQKLYHPYLPSKMARILHAYRSQHGPFHSSADLRKVYPPDTTWCDKLLPYLRFE